MLQKMDPLITALNLYRKRKFSQCVQVCTDILRQDDQHQGAWVLKLRALTLQVTFDDLDVMETLADVSAENQWTKTARPGTTLATARLQTALKTAAGREKTSRPLTMRPPKSGVVRLNQTGLGPSSSRDTADTARVQTGRLLNRLGTASIPSDSQTFVNVARLNHYASLPHLAKPLFEYLYFVQGDVRNALELASQAQQTAGKDEYYWKCAYGRCLVRMGLGRQVLQGSTDWCHESNNMDGFLLLAKCYIIIDQPMAAIDIYQRGLERFPNDTYLLTGIARIQEELRQADTALITYKKVLVYDANNVEAIACIASHFFYTGQPELALVLYRRLLQMGVQSAEVLCNLGLCCLKTQQYDLMIPCFENALSMTAVRQDKELLVADLWFNLGHIALSVGEHQLASLCWKLALRYNPCHAEACNNLAIMALIDGRIEEGRSLLKLALSFDEEMEEAKANLDRLASGNVDENV